MFSRVTFIFLFTLLYNGFLLEAKGQGASSNSDDSLLLNTQLQDTAHALVVIGDVRVTGYKKTKLYIIQREIPFKAGDYLLRTDLQKKMELCRQQLMNTALFVDVEVSIARQTDELVFIDVQVKERWYLFPLPYFKVVDRNLNQWIVEHKGSLQRINYGLKFTQYNVSGRNDKFNLWLINGYTQQFSVKYDNPFTDKKLKNGVNIGVLFSRNREINYMTDPETSKQLFYKDETKFIRQNFQFDLGYSYRPAIKTRHLFKMSYVNEKVDDAILTLNPNYYKNGATRVSYPTFSYQLQHFSVDYIPYPLKGFMGDAYILKKGINDKQNLWQLGGKFTYTFPVFEKSYLQFQAAGLIKAPFKQPYSTQSMFGSSDFYMRGLEYNVIDGVAGGFIRGTAIKQLLDWKIRNPIKVKGHDRIPVKVFLKAFSDGGYSYNPNNNKSVLNNKALKTWGAGIDIVTFYDIVIKLEYSYNQFGQHDLFIHSKSDF